MCCYALCVVISVLPLVLLLLLMLKSSTYCNWYQWYWPTTLDQLHTSASFLNVFAANTLRLLLLLLLLLPKSGPYCTWYRPTTLDQLLTLKSAHNDLKLVGGNSEVGCFTKFKAQS
jgi:hypothetical protein